MKSNKLIFFYFFSRCDWNPDYFKIINYIGHNNKSKILIQLIIDQINLF